MISIKCKAMIVRLIQHWSQLAARRRECEWFGVWSFMSCRAWVHWVAVVCSDLNISHIDFGFLWLASAFRTEAAVPEIFWIVLPVGWLELGDSHAGRPWEEAHGGRRIYLPKEVPTSPQPLGCIHAALEKGLSSSDAEPFTWAASPFGCLRRLFRPDSSD